MSNERINWIPDFLNSVIGQCLSGLWDITFKDLFVPVIKSKKLNIIGKVFIGTGSFILCTFFYSMLLGGAIVFGGIALVGFSIISLFEFLFTFKISKSIPLNNKP